MAPRRGVEKGWIRMLLVAMPGAPSSDRSVQSNVEVVAIFYV